MNKTIKTGIKAGVVAALAALASPDPAGAGLVSVAGPASSLGVAPAIIAAPAFALDAIKFNFGQEGFDEAQGVVTSVDYGTDTGIIPARSLVDSHMIFLNVPEAIFGAIHGSVEWTFDGVIIGVMSDLFGTLEVASTPELGNPGTVYPAVPFASRGLEGPILDGYTITGPNTILVDMGVTQPGDWIRVVTTVPEPASAGLLAGGLLAFAALRRRRKV